MEDRRIEIDYTNHRGERRRRVIVPVIGSLRFQATEWHPHPQWVIDAADVEKGEIRTFAVQDIHAWGTL